MGVPDRRMVLGHEHRCFHYEPYRGRACRFCLGNGRVPELLSHEFTLLASREFVMRVIGRISGLVDPVWWKMRPPPVLWKPAQPSVDPQGLEWEQFGQAVLDFTERAAQPNTTAKQRDTRLRDRVAPHDRRGLLPPDGLRPSGPGFDLRWETGVRPSTNGGAN
jgi:hypothetical protein